MFRNKYILIRNLATIFIACNLLYWIFPFPPIVWRVGLVLLSIYSVFLNNKKNRVERFILIFAFFNLLHFIFSFLWLSPSTTQIGNILCFLLSYSLFARLGEKGVMTKEYFSISCVVLLIGAIGKYYQLRSTMIERLLLDNDADVTNNATGNFLFLIPMLFQLKKGWQKWLVLFICLFFIVSGAKRGNIIAAIIPTLLFIGNELKNSKHSIGKSLLVIIAVTILFYLIYQWFTTNDFLMHRVEQTLEGNSSNRDNIYAHAWQTWYNSDNMINIIFGYGFDGTLNCPLMRHMRAHNDWLEILVDYGLVGILLYFGLFLSLFRQIKLTKDITKRNILLSATLIWFFKALYSMGFTEGDMCLLMISMGYTGINNTQSNIEK